MAPTALSLSLSLDALFALRSITTPLGCTELGARLAGAFRYSGAVPRKRLKPQGDHRDGQQRHRDREAAEGAVEGAG